MMLDTGATDNFVNSRLVQKLGINCYKISEFEAATETCRLKIVKVYEIHVLLGIENLSIRFYVIGNLHHEIIQGSHYLLTIV